MRKQSYLMLVLKWTTNVVEDKVDEKRPPAAMSLKQRMHKVLTYHYKVFFSSMMCLLMNKET